MAVCKQSPEEFIQDVFSPVVSVLCSAEANALCRKNNLSFVELVQPFCRLTSEISIRDPSFVSYTLRNVRLIIKDMKSQPHSPSLTKKMMSDAVSNAQEDSSVKNTLTVGTYTLKYCNTTPWFESYRNVFFQVFYPTEHEFTNRFIACIYVVSSNHPDPLSQLSEMVQEQLIHQQNYVCKWFSNNICKYFILLHDVSVDDLSKAETIYQSIKNTYGASQCHLLQINSRGKTNEDPEDFGNLPDPWNQFLIPILEQNFTPEPTKVQVDGSDNTSSISISSLTGSLGNIHENLAFHPLSSQNFESLSPPDVKTTVEEEWIVAARNLKDQRSYKKCHGLCLSTSDRDRIRICIHDFFIQCLVPYAERQIRLLMEQVMNRKGIHRSIFSATKKWFGSNKPGQQSLGNSANSVVYSQDAPELQVRKLGDIAFMFQLYDVAYHAYHSAKKDFGNDQAWIHYAGALEMAALSVFLQGSNSQRQFPYHYLESAITTYLNSCKLPLFATRSTLLSTETLKCKGMYPEAAQLFIRMTSEDSDLRSALLLEQASLCFLHSKPRMIRKFAFHAILSGHRFSKAGQRKHALRCYQQALEIYEKRHWVLASDHINFTIGRQSLNLKQLSHAYEAFQSLLTSLEQQSALQQGTYLKEYLFVLGQMLVDSQDEKELPQLPIPTVMSQATKVLLGQPSPPPTENFVLVNAGSFSNDDEKSACWIKLEELANSHATQVKGTFSRPHLNCLSNKTNNSLKPLVIMGEPISVELVLQNPLQVPILLTNVHLIWSFFPEKADVDQPPITNENPNGKTALLDEIVDPDVLEEVKLDGLQESKIHLALKPKQMGDLRITAVAFTLMASSIANNSEEESSKPKSTLAVRGKLALEVKGGRLNNTMAEKNCVSYGPDYRLSFEVVNHMPKMQAKFFNFPTNLLCGEVKLINVEFSNVGLCALHRILVASPTPEVFAFGNCGSDETDSYSHFGYAVRSNNSLGNSNNHCASPVIVECKKVIRVTELLCQDGSQIVLEPGCSVTVPLWVRGPNDVVVQHLDLMFYYETPHSNTKLKYRLLQHTFVISTSPSLSLSALARRSFLPNPELGSQANNLVVSIDAHNAIKTSSSGMQDISIVQVNGASQNWCISSIPGSSINGAVHLKPSESLQMNFHVLPFTAKNTVASQEVMVFSQIPLERTAVDSSLSPCSDFCARSLLNLSPLIRNQDTYSAPEGKAQPDACLQYLEASNTVNLTLTVLWKATVQRQDKFFIVMGQHHVLIEQLTSFTPQTTPLLSLLSLQVTNDNYKETLAQKLVKCVLLHNIKISHNFKNSRIAFVPVKLVLSNCCNKDVTLEVNLGRGENVPTIESWPVSQYKWLGATKRKTLLQPLSSSCVSLLAAFSNPGTYNLATVCVTAGLTDMTNDLICQEQLAPSLLVISAVN